MSVFGTIMSKIFGAAQAAVAGAGAAQLSQGGAQAAPNAAPQASAGAQGGAPVDVDAVLTAMAEKKGESLNWRSSIVDLLKVLDLDSGLQSRKQLAGELGYTGNTEDSAAMNIWLHKQVMAKLAQNGGKIPADLVH